MVLCLSSNAWTMDFGIFGSLGYGSGDWTDNDIFSGNQTFRKQATHQGIGFVMDNSLFGSHSYNYRLHLGYEAITAAPGAGQLTYRLNTLAIDQDFGFCLSGSEKSRLWLGPELRVAAASSRANTTPHERHDMFGIGLGPALGFNVLLDGGVPLSFKASLLFTEYNQLLGDSFDEGRLSIVMAIFFR